ncbi:MAG: hypothetical protein ACK55I_31785, partial [bacterium]
AIFVTGGPGSGKDIIIREAIAESKTVELNSIQAFDILMDKEGECKGQEWIVPCLASGKRSQSLTSETFMENQLPFMCRLVYDALPPFFDIILVAHIMNTGIADSVN